MVKPYGGKSTYRRGNTRKSLATIRRKPRRTIVKKAFRTTTRGKRASTALIARNALSLARYNNKLARGSYQQNLHVSRSGIHVKAGTPMGFHVPTPRQGEVIWQFYLTGGVGPGSTTQPISSFVLPTLQQLTGGTGDVKFNMWDEANADQLNGKYFLNSINYTFTVKALTAQPQSIRYRVDFVRPKRSFRVMSAALGANAQNFFMPDCLGAFNGLLEPYNRVNPMYWEFVRKPAYFTVHPKELYDSAGTLQPQVCVVQKHIKIRINKVYNPRDVGTAEQDNSSAYLSIPEYQHLWCIVSSDADSRLTDPQVPEVWVTRQFSWRDRVGHAA